jgi:hypothetical protein
MHVEQGIEPAFVVLFPRKGSNAAPSQSKRKMAHTALPRDGSRRGQIDAEYVRIHLNPRCVAFLEQRPITGVRGPGTLMLYALRAARPKLAAGSRDNNTAQRGKGEGKTKPITARSGLADDTRRSGDATA